MFQTLKFSLVSIIISITGNIAFAQPLNINNIDNKTLSYNPFNPKGSVTASIKKDEQYILVLGDSISNEFGITKGQGWVQHLQNYYLSKEKPYIFKNISVNGLETLYAIDLVAKEIKATKAKIVIIALGSTDIEKGRNIEHLRRNLSTLIDDVKLYQAQPILIGMQLNGDRYDAEKKESFYRVYSNLSTHKNITFVPYLYRNINDKSNWKNYFLSDQFHPNEISQPLMMKNVLYVIDRVLEDVYDKKTTKNIEFVR